MNVYYRYELRYKNLEILHCYVENNSTQLSKF